MSARVTYQHASGDLLEHRNTYFYSTFHGADFLDAWRAHRDQASAELADGIQHPRIQDHGDRPPRTSTEALLETIANELAGKRDRAAGLQTLDRLVQRFEVSKRLHGEYNDKWRPVDPADYRNLEPYVKLAEILDLAYGATGALPYLNALLKCLDTLTALRGGLWGRQRSRVRSMIASERAHVKALAERSSGGGNGA